MSHRHLPHLVDLLKSADVDLRIAAGETLALLCELAQCDAHADLAAFEDEALFAQLRALAKDSAKHRSKRDRKQQRASFRDILRTVERGEFESQAVQFGHGETLFVDNWVRRKEYEVFREVLATGMNVHLATNEFIRETFDLGESSFTQVSFWGFNSIRFGLEIKQRKKFYECQKFFGSKKF